MCLALPAKLVDFPAAEPGVAIAEVSSVQRRVNIELLRDQGLAVGDWVLLHVGFAMSKISEKDAQEQLDLLQMLGEADLAQREFAT